MNKNEENNIYNDYEDWIMENMMDQEEDSGAKSTPDEQEDTPDKRSLEELRGDSVMQPRIRQTKQHKLLMKLIMGITTVIIILMIVIKTQFAPVNVIGPSMYPTLKNGDVLRTTTNVKKENIYYDSIICFTKNGKKTIIKRVIGLPGDTITFDSGDVYVNGVLREDGFDKMKEYPAEAVTLAEDEYYCLGDNRNSSNDSRVFGPVKLEEITNIVTFNQSKSKENFELAKELYHYSKMATQTDADSKNTTIEKENKED